MWCSNSIEVLDLIENLLEKNPDERLQVDQILKHSWLQNMALDQKMNLLKYE